MCRSLPIVEGYGLVALRVSAAEQVASTCSGMWQAGRKVEYQPTAGHLGLIRFEGYLGSGICAPEGRRPSWGARVRGSRILAARSRRSSRPRSSSAGGRRFTAAEAPRSVATSSLPPFHCRPQSPSRLIVQVGGGEPPREWLCPGVSVFQGPEPRPTWVRSVKSLGEKTLRRTTKKKISTWFNQQACTGVCARRAARHAYAGAAGALSCGRRPSSLAAGVRRLWGLSGRPGQRARQASRWGAVDLICGRHLRPHAPSRPRQHEFSPPCRVGSGMARGPPGSPLVSAHVTRSHGVPMWIADSS